MNVFFFLFSDCFVVLCVLVNTTGKKLGDVRHLLKLNREDKQFTILSGFYCDPTQLANTEATIRMQKSIKVSQ